MIHDISCIANSKYSNCVGWDFWMGTWSFNGTIFSVCAILYNKNRCSLKLYYFYTKFSIVESFEVVASSLVSSDDFDGFEFVEDQLTVSAAIVCDNILSV